MTATVQARIAAILREHVWDSYFCSCGVNVGKMFYHADHVAQVVAGALELTAEDHWGPISVPLLDDNGQPVMDEHRVPPVPKHRLDWVTRRRWVTPFVEVGERESSQQLSDRLRVRADTEEEK